MLKNAALIRYTNTGIAMKALPARMFDAVVSAACAGLPHDKTAIMALFQGVGYSQNDLDQAWAWTSKVLDTPLPQSKDAATKPPAKTRWKPVDSGDDLF
jgi:hypothetical protein